MADGCDFVGVRILEGTAGHTGGIIAGKPVEIGLRIPFFLVYLSAGKPIEGLAMRVDIFLILLSPVAAGCPHDFHTLDFDFRGEIDVKADSFGKSVGKNFRCDILDKTGAFREVGCH